MSLIFIKDFKTLINIVIYNSLGFFFLEFLIPYFTDQLLGASVIEIGLIFPVQIVGFMFLSFLAGYFTDKVKSKTNLILIGSLGRGLAYFIAVFIIKPHLREKIEEKITIPTDIILNLN